MSYGKTPRPRGRPWHPTARPGRVRLRASPRRPVERAAAGLQCHWRGDLRSALLLRALPPDRSIAQSTCIISWKLVVVVVVVLVVVMVVVVVVRGEGRRRGK
ncbi:unnamed protein product [Prorocentrum cordatum]|uniref:Uncharacterized protein n=1 Tax=Prorocentrum cordatum TaxID=2364126 RepID=A0ABN9YJN6_9DINO|nr:unnamed protein product [Polarella glacialis]